MVHSQIRWLTPAVLSVAALAAHGQTHTTGARPDPADAKADVPAVVYKSPLAGFRRLADEKPVPWREANDETARIGGWRAYAREAQQPDQPASAAAPEMPEMAKPMLHEHAGHGKP